MPTVHPARHGDLVFVREPIPTSAELKKRTNFVVRGVGSHAHTLQGTVLATEPTTTPVRIRIQESVTLAHGETHQDAVLAPGEYAVYPLRDLRGDVED
jgi:hypothetical protein